MQVIKTHSASEELSVMATKINRSEIENSTALIFVVILIIASIKTDTGIKIKRTAKG